MSDSEGVQKIVDRAVSEVLEAALPELRARLAARIEEELGARPPDSGAAPEEAAPTSDLLYAAFASVQEAGSQADILTALLEGSASFSGRSALIVVKRDSAKIWRARGFESGAAHGMALDLTQPLPARVMQHRETAAAAAADMGSGFVESLGNPADGNATLMPLVVKDKVAALLYADGGDGRVRLDTSALQLLARSTSTWLEMTALRKEAPAAAVAEAVEEPEPHEQEPAVGADTAAAVAESEPPPVAQEAQEEGPAAETPDTAEPPMAAAAAAGMEEAAPPVAPEEAPVPPAAELSEVHRKAKRFARLLVDEIRLYNKDKVNEGRERRDLYDRLRDDIEKSRATYEKRFGQSEAGSADYFNQELVRILANNDATLLGSSFRQ